MTLSPFREEKGFKSKHLENKFDMEITEKYCLRWNDFESNISSTFRDLKEDKDFSDVTLVCDDQQVKANKVVLCASSSFFRRVLKKNPHPHPLIFMMGIKFSELKALLDFAYCGEANVASSDLNTFLTAAEKLEFKGLEKGKDYYGDKSEQQPLKAPSALAQPSPLQRHYQPPAQTEQEYSLPVNNNADQVKVKSEPKQLEDNVLASCEEHFQDGYIQYQEQSKGGVIRDVSDFGNYVVKIVEGENTGKIKCIICGQISRDRNTATRHVENNHFPGTFKYQCDQCDLKFNSKHRWACHRSNVHSKSGKVINDP